MSTLTDFFKKESAQWDNAYIVHVAHDLSVNVELAESGSQKVEVWEKLCIWSVDGGQREEEKKGWKREEKRKRMLTCRIVGHRCAGKNPSVFADEVSACHGS